MVEVSMTKSISLDLEGYLLAMYFYVICPGDLHDLFNYYSLAVWALKRGHEIQCSYGKSAICFLLY